MKNYSKTTEETLITFHISGGGGNRRKIEYCDQDMTVESYKNNLFVMYENEREIICKIGNRENLKSLFEAAIDGDGSSFERLERIGFVFGEPKYFDYSGNPVGLALDNDGTGTIDEDYDTTIVCKLKDCDEEDLLLIHNSNNYKSSDVASYCQEFLLKANLIFEDE